jgi:lipopolysaccharide transport system ATP-binding protein
VSGRWWRWWRGGGGSGPREEFWALQDVSFDVQPGEVLGIVGRNGAGKSTLLKILSRVTQQTAGEVTLRGRMASLLEVGTGFHPELTGRENVFLNGAILGMTKAEIRARFDEITAFAEVERFIDTPVKRYSSGMYVRLAFAVAAHLEPEILIVDEVLAVGDAQFQRKCLGKMGAVSRMGRTVLFVSHNMTAVQSLCNRAILLSQGRVSAEGAASAVVAAYLSSGSGPSDPLEWAAPDAAPGTDEVRIRRVRVRSAGGGGETPFGMQEPLHVVTDFWVLKPGIQAHITYHLLNDQGITVLTTGCASEARVPGEYRAGFTLPGNLLNSGGYSLKLLIVRDGNRVVFESDGIASFSVAEMTARDQACLGREPGVVQPPLPWEVRRL